MQFVALIGKPVHFPRNSFNLPQIYLFFVQSALLPLCSSICTTLTSMSPGISVMCDKNRLVSRATTMLFSLVTALGLRPFDYEVYLKIVAPKTLLF